MAPLPVTAAQALLTSLANNGRQLLDPRGDFLFDPAGFIADPEPPFITSRPAKAIARAACRSWARQTGESTNPAADRLYSEVCGPYLDSIGEGVEGGTIGPPFQGGQCNDTYIVTISRTNPQGGDDGNIFRRTAGPIVGLRQIPTPNNPGSITWQLGSSSALANIQTCALVPPTGFAWRTIASVAVGNVWSIVSVQNCQNPSDNCGNPPPEYERPRPPIVLPPITPIFIDLPDIGPVEVNVNVDAEGLINVESPTLNVEVNLPAPGTPDPTDSGDGGGVVPPPGTPGPQADTGDGGTAEGEAPEGQELVGVQVEVLEFPIGANRFQNNLAEPFRGIGYVRMGYPNRLAIDVSAGVVISPQFFLAPVRGLTNWEVRANVGFINRVTPFYRELPT